MRRVAAVTLVLIAAAAGALFAAGAGDSGEDYKVRAIFDSAGFVIPGEDVKVAGVKVGQIDSLDVTRDFKAIVVLKIVDPGYQDFRADAHCQVRPQSLIGEKFVECEPTQKRAADAPLPPPLKKIDEGKGEGQYMLPVTNTSKAVDLDLINDVMRRPYAERFSLIINELGTGLAGRGSELASVLKRANPALREVDEVLKLLSSQNRVLSNLARDSDTALAPLAREREHVSSFIAQSSDVAEATAERRDDLEADIERLPEFLRELRPTMVRLGALSDEMTPVLSDLGDVAPDINRLLLELGPFSKAAIPAVDSLGEAAKIGTPAITDARPVIADLRSFAKVARPVGATAKAVLESFKNTRGVERLMDYIFYQVTAINGFDSFGHYLRARLILNTCSTYYTTPVEGCEAKFEPTKSQAGASSVPTTSDPILARTRAALAGKDPDTAAPLPAQPTPQPVKATTTPRKTTRTAPAPSSTPAPAAKPDTTQPLMDYLFGKDGA
jgi:phospholipid/cholesterol/gamma-HCH transport system substrate-binding protein